MQVVHRRRSSFAHSLAPCPAWPPPCRAGRSLFSPLVKSLVAEREEELSAALSGREALILAIDRRLRFLAADSRDTLRGRWPPYRQVLLMVRDKLGIRCSSRCEGRADRPPPRAPCWLWCQLAPAAPRPRRLAPPGSRQTCQARWQMLPLQSAEAQAAAGWCAPPLCRPGPASHSPLASPPGSSPQPADQ